MVDRTVYGLICKRGNIVVLKCYVLKGRTSYTLVHKQADYEETTTYNDLIKRKKEQEN